LITDRHFIFGKSIKRITMVRVITQETFDSVVKENIEDLEMSPEEAVEDAVKQFQAQVRFSIQFSNKKAIQTQFTFALRECH
jgi:hypothetical protein